ncbi:hypothetical protein ABEB36_009438 [Hypothenemus hampei]|uniref:Uncharacterized protein n=1 Tax=Hypothenemus hampei TaxID=57062 RepID=A0ABD1DZL3_HYPHA
MDSIENIIERVGRNICLYQEHAVPLPEFSEDDLKYFPICYLEKVYCLCAKAISYFEELCEEKLMTGPVYFKKAREVYVNSNMNSKWENVLTSILRSPTTTEQTRKRIVPDKVYNIGDAIKIIYNSNANPHHIMLKYEEREPIRFTYEEFVKFTDFVFKFMDDEDFVYGFIDCVVPNWFDFVIGQYIFLSCWKNEKTCGLAIQDTKSTDYITLNENEIAMFKTHKYKLYEFLKK